MLKELSNNLNLLMAKTRLNSNELARQVGVPATTIKRIRNNEQANPTLATLLPIAKHFGITINELISEKKQECITSLALNKIPQISWLEFDTNQPPYQQASHKIITEREVSKKAFALWMQDIEIGFLPKNSILIIDPEKKPETGNYVLVANISTKTKAIRKYLIELDQIYLKSPIAEVNTIPLTPEYRILGVIIQSKIDLA